MRSTILTKRLAQLIGVAVLCVALIISPHVGHTGPGGRDGSILECHRDDVYVFVTLEGMHAKLCKALYVHLVKSNRQSII